MLLDKIIIENDLKIIIFLKWLRTSLKLVFFNFFCFSLIYGVKRCFGDIFCVIVWYYLIVWIYLIEWLRTSLNIISYWMIWLTYTYSFKFQNYFFLINSICGDRFHVIAWADLIEWDQSVRQIIFFNFPYISIWWMILCS